MAKKQVSFLTSPLLPTSCTDILELQIGRVRLNVNYIAFRLVGTGLALRIRTPQCIYMGECWVMESVFIDNDSGSGSCGRGARTEGSLQNQRLLLGLWLKEFTMPTIPTLIAHRFFLRGIQVKEIGTLRTEAHSFY